MVTTLMAIAPLPHAAHLIELLHMAQITSMGIRITPHKSTSHYIIPRILIRCTDQSHLSRWFVRYYGVTPGRYQHATAPAAGIVVNP